MKFSDLSFTFKIIIIVISTIALLAVSSSVYNFYYGRTKPQVATDKFDTAPENKKAINVKKEKKVATVPIEVFDKEEIVKRLRISEPIKSDPSLEIVDAKTIPAYNGNTSVMAEWDTKEGKIKIDAKKEPLSFFGFENKKRIGGDIGYCVGKQQVCGDGFFEWNFARIMESHISLYIEVNDNSNATVRFYYEF